MLDDWRTTIMYFDCSCWKSWKSLAGNQGMVVGEEVGKHDGFTLKIASRLFWRWRHVGVFLLFVWLWMGLVWSYSPVLHNADHSWLFQTTWGMVQKLLVVQIIEIMKKKKLILLQHCFWYLLFLTVNLMVCDCERVLASALLSSHLVSAWIVFIFAIFSCNATAVSCGAGAT